MYHLACKQTYALHVPSCCNIRKNEALSFASIMLVDILDLEFTNVTATFCDVLPEPKQNCTKSSSVYIH